ncbi:S8 family peptidase [uncultured Gimesia sp.]|uniref:S8 family peptidase n=1 Tax=uncultured Gimesia sp. TaxID=1678688 RepID=UPI002607CD6E|nr:S8 family peptidase [uncultured Gimesia sp.]
MPKLPHFTLRNTRTIHAYTKTPEGGPSRQNLVLPDRKTHGDKLLLDIERAEKKAKARQNSEPICEGLQFIPMRFEEGSEIDLALKSLATKTNGVRIVNARERNGRKDYLVAVPDSQVSKLADKFRDYRDKDTESGKPTNEPFASSISKIESADLADYWTEPNKPIPLSTETFWWEVWLDSGNDQSSQNIEKWFRSIAQQQNIKLSPQRVRFPDRLVILAFTSLAQWEQFPGLLQHLAEFRRANIVTGEFDNLSAADQAEFSKDLLARTDFATKDSVRLCILDTGVDRGHILLEQSLSSEDLQSWREEWGADDHDGHGTKMAGVCLFGPLGDPIDSVTPITLTHRLESVKILPPHGKNSPPDYGPITIGSMAAAETIAPQSQRVFCLAVTAVGDDLWRPTLWSAHLDQACSGALDGERRLMVVSAGNLRNNAGKNYPEENYVSSVESPAQAWNVLTVGAYTNLDWIQEKELEGYTPVAKPGSLSPTSRTSLCWGDDPLPNKPDVVFEGGNLAKDESGFVTDVDNLKILTTQSPKKSDNLLCTFCDTSAATAQAARMAAILQSEYPKYWPETIRGMIVHSAEWTPQMLDEFKDKERRNRLRVYGMGVPQIERARHSAQGFATMVIQDELQPFRKEGSEGKSNEMHLHDLPLPREVLEELGSLQVRMRVTLSYFIEPNPPRRGIIAQYQYASHGFRFSVRRPEETPDQMKKRISLDARERNAQGKRVKTSETVKDKRRWDLKKNLAIRGSIHSDAWNGTAAELALSNMIAVYPVAGWWRFRRDQELIERKARYSLIVSISTNDSTTKLYDMIETEINNRITVSNANKIVTEIPSE